MAIPYLIHHIWTNWISNCQLWTNWISNSWQFMAIPPSFRQRFTPLTSAGNARKMCRPRWSISKGWSWYQVKNLRTSLAPHSPGGNGFCWKSAETPKMQKRACPGGELDDVSRNRVQVFNCSTCSLFRWHGLYIRVSDCQLVMDRVDASQQQISVQMSELGSLPHVWKPWWLGDLPFRKLPYGFLTWTFTCWEGQQNIRYPMEVQIRVGGWFCVCAGKMSSPIATNWI